MRVRANGDARLGIPRLKEELRLLEAVACEPSIDDPSGVRVRHGEVARGVRGRIGKRRAIALRETAEHGVHEPGGAGVPILLRQLHALVDGRGIRNAREGQDLERADPKRLANPERDPVPPRSEEGGEMMIEERPVAERALDQRRHERGIPRRERRVPKAAFEEPIAVCVSALDRGQELEGQLAGADPLRAGPRRRAALLHAASSSGSLSPALSRAPFA
jgi:hypothetical protein